MTPERIAFLKAKYPGVLFANAAERLAYFDAHPNERMTTMYTLESLERQIDIAEVRESYLPTQPSDVRIEAKAILVERIGTAAVARMDAALLAPAESVERRLLVLAICEPRWLASMADLEANDFTAYAHKSIWAAVRELQQTDATIGPCEVFDALVMADMDRERTTSHWVSLDWLQRLIASETHYDGCPDDELAHLVAADQRHLRHVAIARGRL